MANSAQTRQPAIPSQSLLQGKPYTNAASTDIRKLFAQLKGKAS